MRFLDSLVRCLLPFSLMAANCVAVEAALLTSPVPGINAAIFSQGSFSFDPNSGAISFAGPVSQVQLPGGILSESDPLVLADSVVSSEGTFTGSGIAPLSDLDTTGVFLNMRRTLTVNGQLVYSDFAPRLSFAFFITFQDVTVAVYEGELLDVFQDPSVIESPVLDILFKAGSSHGNAWAYGPGSNDTGNGHQKMWFDTPEPSSVSLFCVGLLILLLVVARRRPVPEAYRTLAIDSPMAGPVKT